MAHNKDGRVMSRTGVLLGAVVFTEVGICCLGLDSFIRVLQIDAEY